MKSMGHVQQAKPTRSSSGGSRDFLRWTVLLFTACLAVFVGYKLFFSSTNLAEKSPPALKTPSNPEPIENPKDKMGFSYDIKKKKKK